jgi:hypothetical protein
LTDFKKIFIPNFIKIQLMGAAFSMGRTDITQIIVAFQNFANAAENIKL